MYTVVVFHMSMSRMSSCVQSTFFSQCIYYLLQCHRRTHTLLIFLFLCMSYYMYILTFGCHVFLHICMRSNHMLGLLQVATRKSLFVLNYWCMYEDTTHIYACIHVSHAHSQYVYLFGGLLRTQLLHMFVDMCVHNLPRKILTKQ